MALLEEVSGLRDALEALDAEKAALQGRLEQATERAESAAAAHQEELQALQDENAALEASCQEAREEAEAAAAALQEDVRALQSEKAALEAGLQEAAERAEAAAAKVVEEQERSATLERARAAAVQAVLHLLTWTILSACYAHPECCAVWSRLCSWQGPASVLRARLSTVQELRGRRRG